MRHEDIVGYNKAYAHIEKSK